MTTWFKTFCVRALVACMLILLATGTALAAPSFSYYSGDTWTTKTKWTSSGDDNAAGWAYKIALGTDTLTLTGPGPYELGGDTSDLSVIVSKSCTVTVRN